jgi:hypothetical protein
MMKTPDLGHFTRSVIQSLENIKFTPSQGICTPSPTILVHHHHHVYGAVPPPVQGPAQEDQISSAFYAGLAAGRAEGERQLNLTNINTTLIPAAMYESPREGWKNDVDGLSHGAEAVEKEDKNDDAKSLDGTVVQEPQARPRPDRSKGQQHDVDGGADEDTLEVNKNKASSMVSRSKSASPMKKPQSKPAVDVSDATHMAFALLSAHGIRSLESKEDIPGEVFDLASLLITLEIPIELITTPASEFCGQGGIVKRLNARQRRTLRRSQERAWKELDALKGDEMASGESHHVRRSYSPTCINYGVNPAALAEYNGYIMAAPNGMLPMSPPGVGSYVQPVTYQVVGHGHPQMANYVPAHGHMHPHGHVHGHHHGNHHGHHHGHQPGPARHHQGHAHPRGLSRFAGAER